MEMRKLISTIFALSSLILILISITSSWFYIYIDVEDEDSYTLDEHYGLFSKYGSYEGEGKYSSKLDYNDDKFQDSVNFLNTMNILSIVLIVNIILVISFIFTSIIYNIYNSKKIYFQIGLIIGIVMIILLFLSPIYLYFALPGATKIDVESLGGDGYEFKDEEHLLGFDKLKFKEINPTTHFSGSYKGGGYNYNWGGDAGWYLAIIAVMFQIGCMISFLMTHEKATEQYQKTQQTQQYPYPLPPNNIPHYPYPLQYLPNEMGYTDHFSDQMNLPSIRDEEYQRNSYGQNNHLNYEDYEHTNKTNRIQEKNKY